MPVVQPNLTVPWGTETIQLSLPEHWHISGVLEPALIPPVVDVDCEILRSLNSPINAEPIRKLAKPGMKVVVVVDDASRPTPVWKIFPHILAELDAAGIERTSLTLLPAIGVHRGMDENELAQRVGIENFGGLNWHNPNCDGPNELAFLGTTSRGTPVWIDKTAAEADLILSIGCIEPHIIASFGGGYKNLIPGIAGRTTIAHNHAINCQPGTFNNVGCPIDKNPMRLDLEEGGRMIHAKVFIINAILDYQQKVVQIVAGDPISAHRDGVKTSSRLYGAKVEKPADIVITASHPMDLDFRQGVKALANTVRAVRPGGVLMCFIKAQEGTGVFGLANRKLPLGRGALKALSPLILPLVTKLKLKGMGEEDRFFLYFALQAMRRATLLVYAPTIPLDVQDRLVFVNFVDSPLRAVEEAKKRFPKQANVLVFPHGGITYPELLA
jgi:lactate racemase